MARKNFENFGNSRLFEGILSVSAVVEAYEKKISDRRIETVYFDRDKKEKKARELSFLFRKAKSCGFKIDFCDAEKLSQMCISNTNGGIAAVCSDRTIPPIDELNPEENGFYVMVEGIEDPYNFGNAIRTLYASGVNGIIVSPRNWMDAAGIVCRSSAGASELSSLYISEGTYAADFFKKHGYKVVCADIDNSQSLYKSDLSYPLFLIVGGEKRGISSALRSKCDFAVRVDYGRPFKNALSAESASSVIAFEIFRQNTFGK